MHRESTRRRSKRPLLVAAAAIVSGLMLSILAVLALGGGPGLWRNSKDLAQSLHDELVVKQIARLRVEGGEARGHREAKGDLARGDLRIKVAGLQPPWFAAYQATAINTYGVGIDQLGCVVDDALLAYARGYNEESMKVIAVKVGEAKLDAAAKAAEAEWTEKKRGAEQPSSQLGATKANYSMNATVRLVTPRAYARVAPIQPARYALRRTQKEAGEFECRLFQPSSAS